MDSAPGYNVGFVPSLTLEEPPVPVRPYPEYAHVRQEVNNTSQEYLGDDRDVVTRTSLGGYRALNFIGLYSRWMDPTCPFRNWPH